MYICGAIGMHGLLLPPFSVGFRGYDERYGGRQCLLIYVLDVVYRYRGGVVWRFGRVCWVLVYVCCVVNVCLFVCGVCVCLGLGLVCCLVVLCEAGSRLCVCCGIDGNMLVAVFVVVCFVCCGFRCFVCVLLRF